MLAPGTRVGRYVIAYEVGAGGMGVVYAAHDLDSRGRKRRRRSKGIEFPDPARPEEPDVRPTSPVL